MTVQNEPTDELREKLAAALNNGRECWNPEEIRDILDDLLPVVREIAAAELREAADLIDQGPTFPLPSSIFSSLVRERADDLHTRAEEAS